MLRRLTLILTLVGVMGLLTAPAVAAARPAQPAATDLTLPITNAPLPGGGTFTGVLDITQLEIVNGVLAATGTLTGTATQGGIVTQIAQSFTDIPLTLLDPNGGKCDILFLDIGPIFLDLLGLQIDLSPIQLDIDAVPGPGNLLGNLLCAVAGLLDGPGLGNAVNNLLGIINQLLGGLA